MNNEIKTIAIQTKEYAMQLLKSGFDIINVVQSKQKQGYLAYVFEDTPELQEEFQRIVRENKLSKQLYGLT